MLRVEAMDNHWRADERVMAHVKAYWEAFDAIGISFYADYWRQDAEMVHSAAYSELAALGYDIPDEV